MDLDKINNAAPKIDKAFTSYWNLFKKHWWKALICLVIYFFYWALTTDLPEDDLEETKTEAYIIEKLYDIDEYGDTILIDVYSDGTRDEYYN